MRRLMDKIYSETRFDASVALLAGFEKHQGFEF